MSDSRDIEDQLKITDADGEVSPADRTEAGANTGSESAAGQEANVGVLGDVAHPFDQTNGIVDEFDEHTAQRADTVTTPGGPDARTERATDAVADDSDDASGRHAAPIPSDDFVDGDSGSGTVR